MIYFDNAATSRYIPMAAMNAFVKECSEKSNPGRGGHSDSVRAAIEVYKAREVVNRFFNNDGECVFTKNCTEALNLAILGIRRKGHVITTVTEHNSVLRPLTYLKECGKIDVSFAKTDAFGAVSLENVKRLLREDTYMIVLNCCSNVSGICNDYENIFSYFAEKGIITVADGAQIAGHKRFDMKACGCDVFASSGHKGLHGLQGTGFLLFNRALKINPLMFGGTGTDSIMINQPTGYPESLESGTLNTAGVRALAAAVKWTDENFESLAAENKRLTTALCDGLKSIKGVRVVSSPDSIGIVSFIPDGLDSESVADHLNEAGIAVRGGLHCAPLMHKRLDTLKSGLVRVSVGRGNTLKEVRTFLSVLEKYLRV